jgi:hypothetical protein
LVGIRKFCPVVVGAAAIDSIVLYAVPLVTAINPVVE